MRSLVHLYIMYLSRRAKKKQTIIGIETKALNNSQFLRVLINLFFNDCFFFYKHDIISHDLKNLFIFRLLIMITEKQVEHVIIPIPHENFITLVPNVIIIFFTVILIGFYIRQGTSVRQRLVDIKHDIKDTHSTSSLPNMLSNSYPRPLSNKTISVMSF